MHEEIERWVTVSVAARHYRVSRNTIYEACREKELVFMRVRSLLRVKVNTNEEYLTVAETAKLLDISTSTVYEACARGCSQGIIPHTRIRSRIRIPRSQLTGFEAQEQKDAKVFVQSEVPEFRAMGFLSAHHINSLNAFGAMSQSLS
jgi:excisionase family DNA binding protein